MIKNTSLVLLWLVLVILAARLVPNIHLQTKYQDLLPESTTVILAETDELIIDVFALPDSRAAALVNNFLEPLLSHLPDAQVNYIDPQKNANLVNTYGISKQGELVVHQEQKHFQLATLSYEAFFNGLKSMSQLSDQWVVFLDQSSGEAFEPNRSNGWHQWLQELRAANYKTVVLPLDESLQLPKQTRLLVLPSPVTALNKSQMDWLQSMLEQGTGILWLADPETAVNQPALSLLFDVMRTDAFHQSQLIIKEYPEHPINKSFDRPLDLEGVMPYQTSAEALWLNESGEVLASTIESDQARMLVTGDSDFLTDAYLKSGGNLEMSYRMIDWLLHNDDRVDLPSIGLNQTQLHYSQHEILWFSGTMLIIIPLMLMVIAIWYWRKRK